MDKYRITNEAYKRFKPYILGFWLVQSVLLFGLSAMASRIILPESDPFDFVYFFQYFIQWTVWVLYTLYAFRKSIFDYNPQKVWTFKWVARNVLNFFLVLGAGFLAEYLYRLLMEKMSWGHPLKLDELAGMYLLQIGTFLMKYFFIVGFSQAVCYLYYLKEKELAEERLKKDYSDLKYQFLSMQIKPHFIFNSQHTIVSLIEEGESRQASAMLIKLSTLMRNILNFSEQITISVREEIENLRNYVDLQQMRFGDTVQASFNINEAVAGYQVPSMILQPLVENCFQHAFGATENPMIRIEGRMIDRGALLSVTDNGCGFTSEDVGRNSHGMNNVRKRVAAIFGREDLFNVESVAGGGTKVSIILPVKENKSQDS